MGCVSSKILTKSGSFQESVSHSFQVRSKSNNVIEEIILSSSKSSGGDQFLALLRTSGSSGARSRANKEAERSATVAELPATIETIDVSELLAGLEEEKDERGDVSSPVQCALAGSSRSFRTVEEFDALVTQQSSSDRAPAPVPEQEEEPSGTAEPTTSSNSNHAAGEEAEASSSGGQEDPPAEGQAENAGAKRRARARQLGELKVPTTFDFSKSGSLRDWLLRGGQIFSPGSYVTPKFGTAPALPDDCRGGDAQKTPEKQHHAVFDPELVAQFERAMEQLSEDEERVLTGILEALELETGDKEAPVVFEKVSDRPVAVFAVPQE